MSEISDRASRLLQAEIMDEYIAAEQERRPDRYHHSDNPNGYISLAVAENKLAFDLLEPKLAGPRQMSELNTGYDDMSGAEPFRVALARFMSESFLGIEADPRHLVATAGAGTALETLAYAIGNPRDGVLVQTPSYAGFWFDLEARAELHIVPVPTYWDGGFRLTPDLLDRALSDAGRPVKALLVGSPNNPLGTVYTPREISELIDWARSRDLHIWMDEIYALSVFGDTPFVSAASVTDMGDDVHIVWAFSKDFAISGFRAGVIYTQNEEVLRLAQTVSYWQSISTDTQFILGEMITDQVWAKDFVTENQRRLGQAHASAVAALDEIGVSAHPSDAGFFLVADFRQHLTEPTWGAERDLWKRILDEANVNITPGSSLRAPEPGLFRICFAAQPVHNARKGIERIGTVISG